MSVSKFLSYELHYALNFYYDYAHANESGQLQRRHYEKSVKNRESFNKIPVKSKNLVSQFTGLPFPYAGPISLVHYPIRAFSLVQILHMIYHNISFNNRVNPTYETHKMSENFKQKLNHSIFNSVNHPYSILSGRFSILIGRNISFCPNIPR